MKITLANAMGTCFGVQDAIDEALSDEFQNNLTIVGQLVHNPQVVKRLKDKGIAMVNSIDELDQIKTKNVMITAHGAAQKVKDRLHNEGFTVYDASCPLVMKVHKVIKKMDKEGYFPVVIGQEKHVEVRGIVGDLKDYLVIETEEDIKHLIKKQLSKIGIVSQTTNQKIKTKELLQKIKDALPNADIQWKNTICKPTNDRQTAALELTKDSDILLVVGGFNSSNTKKLRNVGLEHNIESYHIEGPDDLDPLWFSNKKHCGITAGTSTPPDVIETVYKTIQEIASLSKSNCK